MLRTAAVYVHADCKSACGLEYFYLFANKALWLIMLAVAAIANRSQPHCTIAYKKLCHLYSLCNHTVLVFGKKSQVLRHDTGRHRQSSCRSTNKSRESFPVSPFMRLSVTCVVCTGFGLNTRRVAFRCPSTMMARHVESCSELGSRLEQLPQAF